MLKTSGLVHELFVSQLPPRYYRAGSVDNHVEHVFVSFFLED